jgi:hypothetical protein
MDMGENSLRNEENFKLKSGVLGHNRIPNTYNYEKE